MDSKFTKLYFAIENLKEKEDARNIVEKQLNATLDKLDITMKKCEQYDSPDIISAIKQLFYIKKCSRLLKEAENLFEISGIKLKEWKFALEKFSKFT